ncbi:MAG: cysteine--tRNA ligase [Proteobacteria bacterium]|nr:cysteine--tRNA ligase [Pseudomonadota bacterium]MBU1739234.1 cysteine--tRNA ligase [Pseudomonadota bacterium]
MALQLYNTLTGTKTPFEPITPGQVRLYVCGITAYDYCHIGHARSALVFDMIVKYLRYRGYTVDFVRNFTDIDDKIIKRAAEQNTTCEELSERFIQKFREDMAALKIEDPDQEPKATEHLPEIIGMINELIEKGLAYQSGNDVYYRVEQFNGYGKLSGRKLEEMQAGARISVNENKEHPMDFALWKGSKPGEPTWKSPWGPGRPGWHIECSAMSRKFLGDTFDIHGGGKDLIFPHHENEIAQSEGCTGHPFARNWIHHGFVTIKDEKMSKSLNNFLTIREVLEDHHPEVLRFFVFSTQYRTPLDYSESALKHAAAGLERLYNCVADIENLPDNPSGERSIITDLEKDKITSLANRFQDAMDNDFNTAQGLGAIFETVKDLNRIRQSMPDTPSPEDITFLKESSRAMITIANILGLLTEPAEKFLNDKRNAEATELDITPEEIDSLIEQRKNARTEKNWQRADEIRDMLLAKGIELMDGAEGTTWQVNKS